MFIKEDGCGVAACGGWTEGRWKWGVGGRGGNAVICWALVGWLSQYGEDWSGWVGGRLPDGLKVGVRGAGGKKEEA